MNIDFFRADKNGNSEHAAKYTVLAKAYIYNSLSLCTYFPTLAANMYGLGVLGGPSDSTLIKADPDPSSPS